MVDEEEGVSELVALEHLESSGDIVTILAEIVECLDVGLRLRSKGEGHRCYSD